MLISAISPDVPLRGVAFGCVLAVSGCMSAPSGGTGGGVGAGGGTTFKVADLTALEASLQAQQAQAGAPINRADLLPGTGQATFAGVLSMSLPTLDASGAALVYGEAEAQISFAGQNSAFEGSVSGFRDLDDRIFDGTLTFDGGAQRPAATGTVVSGGAMPGQLGGSLTGPNGETIAVTAGLVTSLYDGSSLFTSTVIGSADATDGQSGTSATVFGSLSLADAETLPE